MYLCSCMRIMSMSWSIAEAVSSGSWPILFKVLTLNVAICIVLLHFSNVYFSLSSVADFSNTGARAPNSACRAPFYPCKEQCGLDKWFESGSRCNISTPRPGLKMLFQGNTPEGSDTLQRPVIERDRVGGLRLMIWDKVKVPFCHYSHATEESDLWTAWQLFPLDDDWTSDSKIQ